MKNLAISAAAIALLAAAPAYAAPADGFTGPRAEVHIGIESLSTLESDEYAPGDVEYDRDSAPGFTYGIGVGYDHGITDRITLGVEASISAGTAEETGFEGYIGNQVAADNILLKRDTEFSARLGYAVTPTALLYAKAGYAIGRMKYDHEALVYDQDYDYYFSENSERKALHRGGLRVGGGAEFKLNSKLFAKVEYRYTDFNDWNTARSYSDIDIASTLKVNRHQMLAAFGYRF